MNEWSWFSCIWLFATLWTVATRLLCPWDFPGKNTGMGCHFLLQGIFLTQGLNSGFPHCRQTLYPLSHQKIPWATVMLSQFTWRLKKKIAALGGKKFFQEKGRPVLRGNGRNRMHHACCCFYQGASSRWRDKAKQTAFPCLPNGPGHRCGLVKGRALL